jgi:hypothetical protein
MVGESANMAEESRPESSKQSESEQDMSFAYWLEDILEEPEVKKDAAYWFHQIRSVAANYSYLIVVAGIIMIGISLVVVLWLFVSPSTTTEKKDFIQAVGVLLAALAGLIGLIFTWKNLNQTRVTTQRTLELTEQGQITERFTRAIDQLGAADNDGNPRLESRLGGIYALERIARDSPRDYGPVMEVLTAYVRANAPRPSRGQHALSSAATEAPKQNEDTDEEWSSTSQRLNADIQAILDVVSRRNVERVPENYRVRLSLERTDLRGAGLDGANLQDVNFIEADLRGATLNEADLRGARLDGANLQGAKLRKVSLQGAEPWAWEEEDEAAVPNLQGANLWKANLRDADLRGARPRGANLAGADLRAATLWEADLREATLYEADFRGADLSMGTDLRGAHLVKADLQLALLQGADLRGAYLRDADLRRANLPGADLRGAKGLKKQQLEQTFGDDTTRLNEDEDWLIYDEGLTEEDCLKKGEFPRPAMWSKDFKEQMTSMGLYIREWINEKD